MNKDEHLIYIPAPEKPPGFDARVRDIVGVCPNGIDTYVRFVWGMDATEHIAGEDVIRYPDYDGKYVGMPFWILEGWQSPDVYNRAEWEEKADVLGPFPNRGVWDFIEVYRTPDFKFKALTNNTLEYIKTWRAWKSKPRQRVVTDLIERRERLAELRDARFEAAKEKIFAEFREHAVRAIENAKNPEYSLPTPKGDTKTEGSWAMTESGILLPRKI